MIEHRSLEFVVANEELIPRDLEALSMTFCYPSSPRKLAMTVACFASGAALFAFGIHLSYLNVAPQQARTKARNDFVKERLRQKQGK